MRFRNDTKLLREYVRRIIAEEDYGGGGYPGMGSMMAGNYAYGVSFGDADSLSKTFIAPFTDVFKTALGQTKELGQKVKTMAKVAFGTIVTTLIPGLGANYAQIFDEEKQQIEKIRSEYADVYKRTDDALGGGDAALLAFMASPGLAIGAVVAKSTPAAAKGLLSAVTGGLSDDAIESVKSKAKGLERSALGDSGESSSGSKGKKSGSRAPSSFFGETQLHEEDPPKEENKVSKLEKILKNKKFINRVLDNPETQQMQKTATAIYRGTLKQVYAEAEKILRKTNSIEEMEKLIKKKIPEIQKLKTMNPEERKVAEEKMISGVRSSMKKFYIKNLKDQVQRVLDAGVPPEAQYVKDYRATIQKIESL